MIARHVFVCVNERAEGGRGSCAGRGAREVAAALRLQAALLPDVAVTECGCLGPCTVGPTLVVYPEAVWYAGVQVADVPELVREHLEGGRPVERLRYHWPATL